MKHDKQVQWHLKAVQAVLQVYYGEKDLLKG